MKNSKIFTLIITSAFMLAGCQPKALVTNNSTPPPSPTPPVVTTAESPSPSPTPTPSPSPTSSDISLDSPFTLKPGQTATFNSSTITFVSVENDSRCAQGVQCIWEGEGKLNLKIEGFKPTSDNITAYSITTIHNTLELGFGSGTSYVLELTDLAPYPKAGNPISADDYTATFKLTAGK